MKQIEQTLTSLEVAEMVGKEHYDVMKDIRRIITHLGEGTSSVTYFIEDNYTDVQGKSRPSFSLTKKGCELYSTRMTGEKGTQFAVAYIERFNQMEKELKQPGNTKLLLRAALEQEERIEVVETDVKYLMDNMRVSKGQETELQALGKSVVIKALGGFESNAYRRIGSKVFPKMWGEFKRHFGIPRYGELPKARFEEGLEFIKEWAPDTSLKLKIKELNNQQHLKLVD